MFGRAAVASRPGVGIPTNKTQPNTSKQTLVLIDQTPRKRGTTSAVSTQDMPNSAARKVTTSVFAGGLRNPTPHQIPISALSGWIVFAPNIAKTGQQEPTGFSGDGDAESMNNGRCSTSLGNCAIVRCMLSITRTSIIDEVKNEGSDC
jgi:hypothetical protein